MPLVKERATIIQVAELPRLHYLLPESWLAACGLLKKKRIDPLRYQKHVRHGWIKRQQKIEKLSR